MLKRNDNILQKVLAISCFT